MPKTKTTNKEIGAGKVSGERSPEPEYRQRIASFLKKELGARPELALPRLVKIVINVGVGRKDEKEIENITKHAEIITGQKCVPKKAKKSIATFKTRQGMTVGIACTLRGSRMYDFLGRFVNITLPRLRDFRGIDSGSIDSSGNLTIGLKEHIVFPEIVGEDVKTPFGLEITLVTNYRSKKEAELLFEALGVPFKSRQ